MKLVFKFLDIIDETEQFAFYAVVGAAIGVGTCIAISQVVFDKLKPKAWGEKSREKNIGKL